MIKTLLKHKLAETAINTFFNKVSNNFTTINIPNDKFNPGTTYACITFNEIVSNGIFRYSYRQCEILHIYSANEIYVRYETGLMTRYIGTTLCYSTGMGQGTDIININNIIHTII